jgi:hypothetical protein
MISKTIFSLIVFFALSACAFFGGSSDARKSSANPTLLARPLGLSMLENEKNNAISIKIKFQCEGSYKIKMFQYKLRVTEGDKEILAQGTQRAWLEPNVNIINLNYPKNRKVQFKNLEISSHTWVRAFSELQLAAPIALTLQECKDLAPY